MSYLRAEEILPKELIEEIQQYVDGKSIYIPSIKKKDWGSWTDTREDGLTSAILWGKLVIWYLFGTLGGTVIAAIQLMISLFIKSFALPVGIALGGGLSGLVFLAKHLGHIWRYSLMAYGMNSNAPQELLESGYAWFVVICIVYIVRFMTISSTMLSWRDV